MNRTLRQQTQLAVVLAVNVYRRSERGETLQPLHLLPLTPLLFWLAMLLLAVERRRGSPTRRLRHTADHIRLVGRLLSIGLNAWAFGLGVTR